MLLRPKIIFSVVVLAASLNAQCALSEELGPYVPKSRAPLDVRKGAAPVGDVSSSDLREYRGEFGGVLYMGQRAYAFESWPGKEISDCRKMAGGDQCAECELIMGHISADYYFYRGPNRQCTLQEIDTHLQVSDSAVLKTLKGSVSSLLGRATWDTKELSTEAGWNGKGSGWKWEDGNDLAYLYMDTAEAGENTEGVARFQWRRSPLFNPSK